MRVRDRWRRGRTALVAVVGSVLLVSGCSGVLEEVRTTTSETVSTSGAVEPGAGDPSGSAEPAPASGSPSPSTGSHSPGGSVAGGRAAEQLAGLEVKGRAPKTGYRRAEFGTAWDDNVSVEFGRNGCRTREDILQRDLRDIVLHDDGCRVMTGTLDDPYTGRTMPFVRGQDTSAQVQIDHVVALSDAWQKGAQQWSAETRRDFANDPRNLQAVEGRVNQQKGDGDAATWLPPDRSYRCTYVSRQIEVKAGYGLWVTAAEKEAMERVLATC